MGRKEFVLELSHLLSDLTYSESVLLFVTLLSAINLILAYFLTILFHLITISFAPSHSLITVTFL